MPGNTKGGSITVQSTSCLTGFWISCMTTDNFCFYLQNGLIQTSQTGGQQYSDTFPFSIPCLLQDILPNVLEMVTSFSEYCTQLTLLKSLQLIDSYDKEFCLKLLWDSLFFLLKLCYQTSYLSKNTHMYWIRVHITSYEIPRLMCLYGWIIRKVLKHFKLAFCS